MTVNNPTPPNWNGGGHYSVNYVKPEHAMEFLRSLFKNGPDSMNWLFLSTSGVHGTYTPMSEYEEVLEWALKEQAEGEEFCEPQVTFLVVNPRLVRTTYGNVPISKYEDRVWLAGIVEGTIEEVATSQEGNLIKEQKKCWLERGLENDR